MPWGVLAWRVLGTLVEVTNMGMQKYRADFAGETSPNGAAPFYARWIGGPSLALVRNCPNNAGISRRTVYATGEPDTFFSIPAACSYKRKRISGFLTCEDGDWFFHAYGFNGK